MDRTACRCCPFWWILIFGLSVLARHEPAAWRSALDLDRSPRADPLIQLFDEALEVIPKLLSNALILKS